jgi:hypothetical protein
MTRAWQEVPPVEVASPSRSLLRGASRALEAGVIGVTFLVAVVPLSLVSRLRRAHWPGGWVTHAPDSLERVRSQTAGVPHRRAGELPPGRVRRWASLTARVVGWAAIVVLVDLAAGAAWDTVSDHDSDSLSPWASTEELAGRPALRDEPWATEQLRAYEAIATRYEPFLMEVLLDQDTAGLEIHDGIRRSCTCGADDDDPEVWFFGGSTTFGRGQRDDHTLPSEVARLAEGGGRPLRVTNLANPGYGSFQEWQLLERRLAAGHRPDLVVFVDGIADVAAQHESPTDGPTHFNRDGVAAALRGEDPAAGTTRSVWEQYLDTSLLRQLVDPVIGEVDADESDGAEGHQAAENYTRARELAMEVAATHAVPVLFVWEPEPVGGPLLVEYRQATRLLPAGVIDLSQVLDGQTAFHFDWYHVDEQGAARLAAELYPRVTRALEAG